MGFHILEVEAEVVVGESVADFSDLSEGAGSVDESSYDLAIGGSFPGEDVVEDLIEFVEEESARTEAEAADVLLGGLAEIYRFEVAWNSSGDSEETEPQRTRMINDKRRD